MGLATVEEFETSFSTPIERQIIELEQRIYSDPDGWRLMYVEAINDINNRLTNQYKFRGLTKAEANDLAKIIFERTRRGTDPVWSEDWSKWVVERVLRQPIQKGRPPRMKGSELGGSATPPARPQIIVETPAEIVLDGISGEAVQVVGREGEDEIEAEILADKLEFMDAEEIDDASYVDSDEEADTELQ